MTATHVEIILKMYEGCKPLELTAEHARKCWAARIYLGSANRKNQMKQYIYRRDDNQTAGAHIFNQKLW